MVERVGRRGRGAGGIPKRELRRACVGVLRELGGAVHGGGGAVQEAGGAAGSFGEAVGRGGGSGDGGGLGPTSARGARFGSCREAKGGRRDGRVVWERGLSVPCMIGSTWPGCRYGSVTVSLLVKMHMPWESACCDELHCRGCLLEQLPRP